MPLDPRPVGLFFRRGGGGCGGTPHRHFTIEFAAVLAGYPLFCGPSCCISGADATHLAGASTTRPVEVRCGNITAHIDVAGIWRNGPAPADAVEVPAGDPAIGTDNFDGPDADEWEAMYGHSEDLADRLP